MGCCRVSMRGCIGCCGVRVSGGGRCGMSVREGGVVGILGGECEGRRGGERLKGRRKKG